MRAGLTNYQFFHCFFNGFGISLVLTKVANGRSTSSERAGRLGHYRRGGFQGEGRRDRKARGALFMIVHSPHGTPVPVLRAASLEGRRDSLSGSTALSGSLARIFNALVPMIAAGALIVSAESLAQSVSPNTLPSGGSVVG